MAEVISHPLVQATLWYNFGQMYTCEFLYTCVGAVWPVPPQRKHVQIQKLRDSKNAQRETPQEFLEKSLKLFFVVFRLLSSLATPVLMWSFFLFRKILQRVLASSALVRSCVDITVCMQHDQCGEYNGPITLPHLLVRPPPSPLLLSLLSPSYPVFIRLCDFLIPLFSSSVWKLTLLHVIMEGPGLLIIWRDHHRDPRPCSPKPALL